MFIGKAILIYNLRGVPLTPLMLFAGIVVIYINNITDIQYNNATDCRLFRHDEVSATDWSTTIQLMTEWLRARKYRVRLERK